MIRNSVLTKVMSTLVIGCIVLSNQCGGQAEIQKGSPEWLVSMYFVQKDFPEKSEYLIGEMTRMAEVPTFGSTVPDGVRVTYRMLQQNDTLAIYAINASDTAGNIDIYCYVTKDEQWNLEAIRTLALPGFVFMLIDSLENTPDLDDSTQADLANLQLLVSSDSNLSTYLTENLAQFEALIEDFDNNRQSEVDARTAALRMNSIDTRDEFPGCIFVTIGGIMDNVAGYIYAENEESVPKMSPSEFIYVEQVAPRWFLFKTT